MTGKICVAAMAALMAFVSTTHAEASERAVRAQFASAPILIAIARCESQFRQFDDRGRVLKNPNSSATGVMQIMSSVHRRPAAKLGYNIFTLRGNLGYALHLYRTEGTTPWKASRGCWS